MSDNSAVGILAKFLVAVLGLFYTGLLLLYSDAPYVFHMFFFLVLVTFIITQLTRKFFKKRYWWTGFIFIYAGLTAYHFYSSEHPEVVFQAMWLVFKKHLSLS